MPVFRLPLSGNVTQSINPWTWMFNPVGSQVGLVNIELGQSSNPAVEEEVLSDVASYGKQLGRIEDALLVLLAHFHPERELTVDEQKALSDLKAIATDVAAVKTKHRRRTAS
jgi:hypothetical protein